MPLRPLRLEPDPAPLPDDVARLLADGRARVDAHFARPDTVRGRGFVPSDPEVVYRALRSLRRAEPDARRFCEWGSGFGVVAGCAAALGFEAHGIEIDKALVAASRDLLLAHGLDVAIVHGSFVPADSPLRERPRDLERHTVLHGSDAWAEMDLDVDDFDVVFAYPWPGEEDDVRGLFARRADYGAVLLTYSATDGVFAHRKVAASGRDADGRSRRRR